MVHRRSTLLALALLVAGLGACGSGGSSGPDPDGGTGSIRFLTCGQNLEGQITVSAAASLTEAFTEIGEAFEDACPATGVEFNFDSSGTLAQQILDGAPADVFASADEANMTKLRDAGRVTEPADGEPAVFARNQLAIVTKPGNPDGIRSLADLVDVGVISLCGEDVPCGIFAAAALASAEVSIPEDSVTRSQNAKATLTAVSAGDAVAGIVYSTDALAAGDGVSTVEIPSSDNVIARYPVARLRDADDADVAAAFVSFLSTDVAQAVLAQRGFLPPS